MQKITRKTLLYKSGVEYADYGLNHVEGCSHGCTYPCYAMMMKKRCGIINSYKEWLKPKIVSNALELLDKEIPKYKKDIKYVFLCFATDPFMYKQKEICDLSLKVTERLNKDNIKSVCISKGIYPKQLVKKEIYGADNEYGSTIVSLLEDFKKKHEPFAAPIKERIKALKFLHDSGLKTWVSMEPYPTPNFIKQDIEEILREIKFVDKIVFGKWNYNGMVGYFKDYKTFYNDSAYKVIKFCEKNNIKCHIKQGTIDDNSILKQKENTSEFRKLLLRYNAV
ncbi:MAG: radical SAM protein [bacterium]|nr:radical SAM protein [bacterium]